MNLINTFSIVTRINKPPSVSSTVITWLAFENFWTKKIRDDAKLKLEISPSCLVRTISLSSIRCDHRIESRSRSLRECLNPFELIPVGTAVGSLNRGYS